MKRHLLFKLHENLNTYISGEQLAQSYHVSRMAISKNIKKLKEEGYEIDSSPKLGYKLIKDYDPIDSKSIKDHVPSFFHTIEYVDKLTSTNDIIKNEKLHEQEGYVLISNQQTKGRGRNQRLFQSNQHKGIYMSILLKPTLTIYESLKLTACISVAAYLAIKKNYAIDCDIKWVNDLFLNGKKIGGILSEAAIDMNTTKLDYMIIGIGINVHQQIFNKEVNLVAASIEDFTSLQGNRSLLIQDLLTYFYEYYKNIHSLSFLPIYKARSLALHNEITVIEKDDTYTAYVSEISENAELILKKKDDTTSILNSGEISIKL